jgi:hypothetical protein
MGRTGSGMERTGWVGATKPLESKPRVQTQKEHPETGCSFSAPEKASPYDYGFGVTVTVA